MLRIEQNQKTLSSLRPAEKGSLTKRYDLGEVVFNSPGAFFAEVGQELFVVSRSVQLSSAAQIQLDLLALDREGQAVLVFAQHGDQPPQLARAITCAGTIAQWTTKDFLERMPEGRLESLDAFLRVRGAALNSGQRAILIAEDFDYEELTATNWLRERHGMDFSCVRVSMAADSQGGDYISCTDLSKGTLPLYKTLSLNGSEGLRIEPEAGGRRKQPRSDRYISRGLKINSGGREVDAELVDMSNGGLGVKTMFPIPVASSVLLTGELHGGETGVEIEGRADVTHCTPGNERPFRIGLNFEEVQYRRIPIDLQVAGTPAAV